MELKALLIKGTALTFALATGLGFSGAILIAASLLQTQATLFSASLISKVAQTLYLISAVSWAAVYYGGMHQYLTKQFSGEVAYKLLAEEHHQKHLDAAEVLSSHYKGDKEDFSNILANERLNTYIARDHSLKEEIKQDEEKKGSRPKRLLKRMIEALPLIRNLSTDYRRRNALSTARQYVEARISAMKTLMPANEEQASQYVSANNTKKETELIHLHQDSVERDIPQIPNGSIAYIRSSIVNLLTDANTYLINSLGLVMFGAIPFIATMGITSVALKYASIALFWTIGAVGALGLTKPSALSAVQSMCDLNKESKATLQKLRKNTARKGFFRLPATIQQMLAIFMAVGIAVGNFTANVAIGQALFGGASLFDPKLISSVMSNPMAAHPFSLALGLIAAIGTSTIASIFLIQTTQGLDKAKPQSDEEKKTWASSMKPTLIRLVASFASIASIIAGYAFRHSRQVIPFVRAHLLPILSVSAALNLIHMSYQLCKQDGHHFITNSILMISTVGTALAALIMSANPGTIYFRIFGAKIAKVLAGLTCCANLELGKTTFAIGSDTINHRVRAFLGYKSPKSIDETEPLSHSKAL